MSIAQAVIKQKIPDHPGPGQYETQRINILPKNPSYSIAKSKSPLVKNEDAPGPGFYQIKDVEARLKKSISYTFKKSRPKHHIEYTENLSYNPNYMLSKSNAPAYSINKSDFPITKISDTPGPGDYIKQIKSTLSKGGVLFPSQIRKNAIDSLPGPGDYRSQDALDKLTHKNPSALMPTAKQVVKKEYLPGPGQYETSISSINRHGGIISKDSRREVRQQTPGPADYTTDSLVLKRKNPRYAIMKESKTTMQTVKELPGPGKYDILSSYEKILNKAPKIVIPRSQESKKHTQSSPGPGSYTEVETSLSRVGGTIEKSKLRGFLNESLNPGPGQYRVSRYSNLFQSKKGHTIGKSKNKNPQNEVTPGPGHYLNEKLTSSLPQIKLKNCRFSHKSELDK